MADESIILREMVRFEKIGPNAAVDAGGHVDETRPANWIEYCTRRAEVVELGVTEVPSPDGEQPKSRTIVRVRLRWDVLTALLKPEMRGIWLTAIGGPRILNLQGKFDPKGTRRLLTVNCLGPTS